MLPVVVVALDQGAIATIALLGVAALGHATLVAFEGGALWRRPLRFVAHFTPVLAVIALAGAAGSAVALDDIVEGQQLTRWGWHAWSSPFALGVVLAATALIWPLQGESGQTPLASVAAWIAATPQAMLIAAAALGGWSIPGVRAEIVGSSGVLLAIGCLLFLVKTWVVLFVARLLNHAGLFERRRSCVAFFTALTAVGLKGLFSFRFRGIELVPNR